MHRDPEYSSKNTLFISLLFSICTGNYYFTTYPDGNYAKYSDDRNGPHQLLEANQLDILKWTLMLSQLGHKKLRKWKKRSYLIFIVRLRARNRPSMLTTIFPMLLTKFVMLMPKVLH